MNDEHRKEILAKVSAIEERRAFINRCLNSRICPDCGGDLVYSTGDESEEMEYACTECTEMVEHKKYLIFGPVVQSTRRKRWYL